MDLQFPVNLIIALRRFWQSKTPFLILSEIINNTLMGKGDKKSKKGKIWRGSYGRKRNKNAIKARLKKLASVKKKPVSAQIEKPKAKRPVKKKDAAE